MRFALNIIGAMGLLLFINCTENNCYAQYSGGSGLLDDPYQINSLNDLQLLSNTAEDWSKHFILTSDIDASETYLWNDGMGFLPIGNYDTTFIGYFNGDNHVIRKLYINQENNYNIGFFGYIDGGRIENLILDSCFVLGGANVGTLIGSAGKYGSDTLVVSGVEIINCNVTGVYDVGGFVGGLKRGIIVDCSVSGYISGNSLVGGIAGSSSYNYGGRINSCSTDVIIEASSYAGGIIGDCKVPIYNCNSKVEFIKEDNYYYSYFAGIAGKNISIINKCSAIVEFVTELEGSNYVGGIVSSNSGSVLNCFTEVMLHCPESDYIGGIVAENEGSIKNSYSTGTVNGNAYVGGLIGINKHGSHTLNSFTTSHVIGNDYTGGFIGENSYFGTITNCYSSGEVDCNAWFSGGFVGLNRSTAYTYNCFYDKPMSRKETGAGMDHNGQNQKVIDLITEEFGDTLIFINANWDYGYTDIAPWQNGTAPDGFLRPVLYYQTYTVRFESTDNGTIEPDNPFEQIVNCGRNTIQVEAIPDDGYYFVKWQTIVGDSITKSNPIIVENVTQDSLLIAVFDIIDVIFSDNKEQFLVYPNPAHNRLNIDIPNSLNIRKTRIEVIDLNGHVVLKHVVETHNTHIDISNINKGVYLIKIQSDKLISSMRIIIM